MEADRDASPLLEVRSISKRFKGILALDDVSLVVNPEEIVALVGPNGAGKTTLFNCVCGQIRPDEGETIFQGRRIDHLPVHRRARLGIRRTFQRIEVFPELTAREHLLIAERARRGDGRLWKDLLNLGGPSAEESENVEQTLELLGLGDLPDTPVGALSLGHNRLVEMARALIGEPLLLMADEPSSGLDVHERQLFSDVLRHVQQARKMAVLLVEHDFDVVARLASRVVVFDFGRRVAEGSPEEVIADREVQRAYLGSGKVPTTSGSTLGGGHGRNETPAAPPQLELVDVSASYGSYQALFGISFSLPMHGILALLGSNGAGKSSVARVVTGLIPPTSGTILVGGKEVTGLPAWRIARLGVDHVAEGRSVFGELSVEENLVLAFRRKLGRRRVGDALGQAFDAFPALAEARKKPAAALSGGQQRMLSLGKAFSVPPQLLVVDELSFGLAPALVDAVYAGLLAIRDAGTSLLLIEQQVNRALTIADRAVVLLKGRVGFEGPASGALSALPALLGSEVDNMAAAVAPPLMGGRAHGSSELT